MWMKTMILFCLMLSLACQWPGMVKDMEVKQDMRFKKKIIETDWDQPDTRWVREHLSEMEKQPFDGLAINVTGSDGNGAYTFKSSFIDQKWQGEWFQSSIDDLKACQFARFTDNFLMLNANPGDVDWFNDEGWKNIVEHWRMAARIAKQGGLKGIVFDAEPYTAHCQFAYWSQPEREKHTFDEYYVRARERGRQVMKAVSAEYPDITLLCYHMNIDNVSAARSRDQKMMLQDKLYGLYPAFIDGWLDVCLPTIKFVDGCEIEGYRANSPADYLNLLFQVKNAGQQLVAPENRAKYRAQVQLGIAFYMDAYTNPPGNPWSLDMKGMPPADRLHTNLFSALRVTDEYIWIYGEQYTWWPTVRKAFKGRWSEVMPGCDRAVRLAQADNLEDYAIERVKKGGLANLARNGDFSNEKTAGNENYAPDQKAKDAPPEWKIWQEGSSGTLSWDRLEGFSEKGAARISGVYSGCLIQKYQISPGACYAIQVMRRIQGKGNACVTVGWQTPSGKWIAQEDDVPVFSVPVTADKWMELAGAVSVPDEAGFMVLILEASGQPTQEDSVWFDDVRVHKLDD
ncbi:MAG: hypothetical protein HZA48_03470 [Planctomycetes bacterium]|nr:hypothetical protein [Planctomycetota bacterium]